MWHQARSVIEVVTGSSCEHTDFFKKGTELPSAMQAPTNRHCICRESESVTWSGCALGRAVCMQSCLCT